MYLILFGGEKMSCCNKLFIWVSRFFFILWMIVLKEWQFRTRGDLTGEMLCTYTEGFVCLLWLQENRTFWSIIKFFLLHRTYVKSEMMRSNNPPCSRCATIWKQDLQIAAKKTGPCTILHSIKMKVCFHWPNNYSFTAWPDLIGPSVNLPSKLQPTRGWRSNGSLTLSGHLKTICVQPVSIFCEVDTPIWVTPWTLFSFKCTKHLFVVAQIDSLVLFLMARVHICSTEYILSDDQCSTWMFSLKLKGTLFWLLCAVFIIAVYTSQVC